MIRKGIKDMKWDYIDKIKRFTQNSRLFLMYVFLTSLNLGVYKVIFNLYIIRIGYSEEFLGILLAMTALGTGIFSFPAAVLCDRIGRKNTLLMSCILMAFSMLLLYTTEIKELLIIFSLLYGGATSLNIVTGSTFMLENSHPCERLHLFSVYQLLSTVSTMIGAFLGGYMPYLLTRVSEIEAFSTYSYRLALLISVIAVFIAIFPLKKIKEPDRFKKCGYEDAHASISETRLSDYINAFKKKPIQFQIFIYIFFGLGWGLALPYFNVYMDIALNISSDKIGIIYSLAEFTMMIALFALPAMTNAFGRVKTVSLVQLLSIPFLFLFIGTTSTLLVGIAYVMRSTLMNMANPIMNNFKLEIVAPNERSVMNSITWMTCYLFVGIGTYIGGNMLSAGYYKLPFTITAFMYASAAFFYYILFSPYEKRTNKTENM